MPRPQCTKTDGTPCRKTDGTICKRIPARGMRVCIRHGGASPQVKRKAAERLALQEAHQMAIDIIGQRAEAMDPLDALVEAQINVEAMIEVSSRILKETVEEHGTGSLTVTDKKGTQAVHPHYEQLRHLNEQYARIAQLQVRTDVSERRVRIEELKGAHIEQRLRNGAIAMGLDLNDPRVVAAIQAPPDANIIDSNTDDT